MLRCTADENPASWLQRLSTIMSAYQMSVYKVTGVKYVANLSGHQTPGRTCNLFRPFVALRNAYDWVRRATKRPACVQRKYYDEKSRQT